MDAQRPDLARDARDREIYQLVTREGWTQSRVAEKFGITQSRVSQICSEVDSELRLDFINRIRNLRTRATQQLDELLYQAMEGWHRSRGDQVEVRVTESGEGERSTTTITRRSPGDPRFLDLAAKLLRQKLTLWDSEIKSDERGGNRRRFSGMDREQALRAAKEELEKRLGEVNRALQTKSSSPDSSSVPRGLPDPNGN